MENAWAIILLIIGFIALIKGADFLVDGASGIARRLHIPEIIIGLTIISIGTSAPEISVAFQSFAASTTDLTLGDIVGCAISNILLLVGISSLIKPIRIKAETIRKEIPLYILIVGVFIALIVGSIQGSGKIDRTGGAILMMLFGVFFYYIFSTIKKTKSKPLTTQQKKEQKKLKKTATYVIMTILGLAAVIVGSELVVNSATEIAEALHISDRVIALTIVALGTSLPELITTISASKKGEQDLVIGNVIGTNIFNICFVLGLPILIFGALPVSSFKILDLVMMALAALILLIFVKNDRKVSRLEGIVMVTLFLAYYAALFIWP